MSQDSTMPKQNEPKKLDLRSEDVSEQKRAGLKTLFPGAFTESKNDQGELLESIDYEKLKAELGTFSDVFESRRERYGMDWPGKKDCMKLIQQPSIATLKPDRESSVNFDETENLFIEGDNLEVLKQLQKSYYGKVKMIYIDPPYNTGKEFIYPDKYSESLDTYLAYAGLVDAEGKKFSTNSESEGRFHTKWLNMIYPRLYLARNLLREDGIAFISIGQDELSNLLSLTYDIFGEENLVTICSRVMKTGGQKGVHFSPCVDYIIAIAKNVGELNGFREQLSQNVIEKVYTKTETEGPRSGEKYRSMGLYQAMLDKRANQRFFIECPDGQMVLPPGETIPSTEADGEQVTPGDGDGVWRWTYKRFHKEKTAGNVEFIRSERTSLVQKNGSPANWNVYYKIWLNDRLESGQLPGNILVKFESRHSSAELKQLEIPFDFAKPSALVKFLMSICGVGDKDITLDFFAGSASTGHAAMELAAETGHACPFICVQLPEKTGEESEERRSGYSTITEIAAERLRRVGKRISENQDGQFSFEHDEKPDLGFKVFTLDQSNFDIWDGTNPDASSDEISKQLSLYVDHINPDASQEDILYELLLKSGFMPTEKVEKLTLAEKTVYSVSDGALLICLEDQITREMIDAVAEAEPLRFICLDKGFQGNDQLKANAVQTFAARNQGRDKTDQIVFRTV